MSKKLVTNDLKELRTIMGIEKSEKEIYQENWKINKFHHRKMVAKKNRKWLQLNSKPSDFTVMNESNPFGDFPEVRNRIIEYFNDENKRKWILHLITNFIPLNRAKQVPKLPKDKFKCQLSNLELTDLKSILIGNRDKHIAFTGFQTSNVISGIALNELYKFVIDCTYNFDTREAHIVNFAIDELRSKEQKSN